MTPSAEGLYIALVGRPSQIARRLQYRCGHAANRCLLLDAIEVPKMGILLHQKRYKYSDEENLKRSNEAGRRTNTFDGNNHWRPRTYWMDSSALAYPDDASARLGISCDHVLDFQLLAVDFRADWTARHAQVIVRPDGSRYVPYS